MDKIDKIVVATDDPNIAEVSKALDMQKLTIFNRSKENASDVASTESVILEYIRVSDLNPDDKFILVQATSPFTQPDDFESGLMFYNARYYDPSIGRFISPDSVVDGTEAVMGFNRYAYTHGNPITYSDPSGNFIFSAASAILGILTATITAIVSIETDTNFFANLRKVIGAIGLVVAPFAGFAVGSGIAAHGGFTAAIAAGIVGGVVGGAITGAALATWNGDNLLVGSFFGAVQGAAGGFAGSFVGYLAGKGLGLFGSIFNSNFGKFTAKLGQPLVEPQAPMHLKEHVV